MDTGQTARATLSRIRSWRIYDILLGSLCGRKKPQGATLSRLQPEHMRAAEPGCSKKQLVSKLPEEYFAFKTVAV
jgi:hypothetical protein